MKSSSDISRRTMLSHCAGALAAGVAITSRLPNVTAAETSFPPGKFFDVHTHVGQVWNEKQALKPEVLLAWMDSYEVSQAVVLPLVSPESSSYLLTTEFVLEATKPHRDRLIPFCCIDPRTSYGGGKKRLVDMLKRYVDAGVKGFGEHKPGVRMDDLRNMTIYSACAELKLPMLFHLDGIRNVDAPGLPGLEKALKEFPELPFIGHGPGWWASISGDATEADINGYPDGPIAPGGAIDVLMEKYPNLFGDLSAGSGAGAFKRDMKFAREFVIRRADRLIFGSDILAPGQDVPQFIVLRQLDLPPEIQAKVFRDNARRLILNA